MSLKQQIEEADRRYHEESNKCILLSNLLNRTKRNDNQDHYTLPGIITKEEYQALWDLVKRFEKQVYRMNWKLAEQRKEYMNQHPFRTAVEDAVEEGEE